MRKTTKAQSPKRAARKASPAPDADKTIALRCKHVAANELERAYALRLRARRLDTRLAPQLSEFLESFEATLCPMCAGGLMACAMTAAEHPLAQAFDMLALLREHHL